MPNYVYDHDNVKCNKCMGNWDILTGCTDCLNYYYDEYNLCGSCPDGYDSNCLECLDSKLNPEKGCVKENKTLLIIVFSITGSVIVLLIAVVICLLIIFTCKYLMKKKNKIPSSVDEIELIEKKKSKPKAKPKSKPKKKKKKKGKQTKEKAEFNIDKSLFKISASDIKLLKELGDGGTSTVYLCSWKGKKVVAKLFKTRLLTTDEYFGDFEKELSIVSSISHPNIVTFFGASLDQPRVMLVLEYCKLGDLSGYISNNKGKFDVKLKIRILLDVATALEYLHERNIIHRDIKPENILLTENKVAKVTDFGISRVCKKMTSTKTRFVGSSFYMSPEVITTRNYTEKIDVYSFSIVCYVLFEETLRPFLSIDEDDSNVIQKVAIDPTYRPFIHQEKFSNDLKWVIELITSGWKHESNERSNFTEIRKILQTKI